MNGAGQKTWDNISSQDKELVMLDYYSSQMQRLQSWFNSDQSQEEKMDRMQYI